MRITVLQRIMLAIAVALAVASCGAQLAAGAARAAASGAEAKAKGSAAAAGVAITPLPQPANLADADAQIAHWKQVAREAAADKVVAIQAQAAAEGREAAANDQIVAVAKERDALVLEAWRTRLAWAAGLMLVGILAGVALEFILPPQLRGWATILISASTAVGVSAWVLRALLPWLKLIALAAPWVVVAGVLCLALWWVWRLKHSAKQAADHGERMEEVATGAIDWMDAQAGAVVRQSIADVKTESAKLQHSAGVATVLAHLRGKDPTKAAIAAARPPPPPIVPPAAASPATAPTEIVQTLPPSQDKG